MLTRFLYHVLAVQDIGFIGIHTKPDEAEKEVDRLVDVYDTVSEKFQTEVPPALDWLLWIVSIVQVFNFFCQIQKLLWLGLSIGIIY